MKRAQMSARFEYELAHADHDGAAPTRAGPHRLLKISEARSQQWRKIRHGGALPGDAKNLAAGRSVLSDDGAVRRINLMESIPVAGKGDKLTAQALLVSLDGINRPAQNAKSRSGYQKQSRPDCYGNLH